MSKENNSDPVGAILAVILKGLFKFFIQVIRGLKGLTSLARIIGLGITVSISIVSYLRKELFMITLNRMGQVFKVPVPSLIQLILWGLTMAVPLMYLAILGTLKSKDKSMYDVIFRDIGFIGKNNKTPYFLYKKENEKKIIYAFQSNIPLTDWVKAKDRLEVGLGCSIRQIREGTKKGIIELVTVSSDYKIPEMLRWKDDYILSGDGVLCIGEGDLDYVKFDLNRTPHVLAAGETGSGKSVILRCMLWQMIKKGCRIYMIDFKGGVEFGKVYEKYGEVITDRLRALTVLEKIVKENNARLKLFREMEVKNLKEYNQKTHENLSRIGVFIDEIAEMLDKKGVAKEDKAIYEQLESYLSTLARLSRATGINLFLGVQRPDANVLTGQIKNNVPVRISGRFADKTASEIVLGNTSACNLPDIKGRFLYKVGNETIEFQSFYFDDEKDLKEIEIKHGNMLTIKDCETKERLVKNKDFYIPEKPEPGEYLKNGEEIELDFNFNPGISKQR